MPNSVIAPHFLTRSQVEAIHQDQITRYGGMFGVRDSALLQSAISTPQAFSGGEFLHKDVFEMASAYAFHISQNQPFNDGNKRTGMASSLLFLDWNEYPILPRQNVYESLIRRVSANEASKEDIADFLRGLFLK